MTRTEQNLCSCTAGGSVQCSGGTRPGTELTCLICKCAVLGELDLKHTMFSGFVVQN